MEEDPWGISSYEKFLAAILAGIAEERSDSELQARADELHATRDESGRQGEEALREAVGSSRLVLLVENLDDVFRRIGENGQERFRAFVEDWQQLLIVATAQQLFEGVQLHESPFYGFFAITRLEELSLDSAAELMRRIAELRGDEDLVRFLRSDVARGRLAAVEALAGGHPRIWLLLSGCVSIDAIDALVPLFLEALDDLTPYYQDRLRELGIQQQELVVLLSEAGGALSNRALAERSGIAQNQVATILGQLAERGYVRRAEVPEEIASGDARMSYWELREPLMRLCLDVKQARGKPLRMVVEFLRAWYGPRLLDELVALPPGAELASTYVSEAFRTLPDVLSDEELLRGSPEEILARAEVGLAADPKRRELQVAKASALLMKRRYAEARDVLEPLVSSAETTRPQLGLEIQLIAAKKGLGESVDEESMVRTLLELSEAQPDVLAVQEFVASGLNIIDRHEEALDVFERAIELGSESVGLLAVYGRSLAAIDLLDQALEVLERALELDPNDFEANAVHGFVLSRSGRPEESLEAFGRAIELAPRNSDVHQLKANALVDLDRHEEALEVLLRALKFDPESPKLHGTKGAILLGLERYSEALDAFAEASRRDAGNGLLWEIQASLLDYLDRPEAALDAARRVTELEPDNASAWSLQADVLVDLERIEEAEQAAQRAVELDPENPTFWFGFSEVGFAMNEVAVGVQRLREALAVWGEKREGGPGDPEMICALLWDHWESIHRQIEVVDQVVAAYDEVDTTEDLGRGLVESAAWLADPDVPLEEAEAWVDAWAGAREVEELQIPLRLLRAAAAWKKDQDRAHLLALPPEQREILVGLLTPETDDDSSS
ncbi:MAG TPA: tetratricopeptide repeat protein [Solirubrobacterales bacterium]|nr:tetratricopeptide repeat protein [Solirubrobacterales bacterium]